MPKAVVISEAVTKKVNSLNEELAGRLVRLISVVPPNVTLKALGVPPSGSMKRSTRYTVPGVVARFWLIPPIAPTGPKNALAFPPCTVRARTRGLNAVEAGASGLRPTGKIPGFKIHHLSRGPLALDYKKQTLLHTVPEPTNYPLQRNGHLVPPNPKANETNRMMPQLLRAMAIVTFTNRERSRRVNGSTCEQRG